MPKAFDLLTPGEVQKRLEIEQRNNTGMQSGVASPDPPRAPAPAPAALAGDVAMLSRLAITVEEQQKRLDDYERRLKAMETTLGVQ